jgi:hypothetical protein
MVALHDMTDDFPLERIEAGEAETVLQNGREFILHFLFRFPVVSTQNGSVFGSQLRRL